MGVKGGSNNSSSNNSSVSQNTGQSAGANGSVGMSYGQTQAGNQSNNSSSSSSFGNSQSSQDVWGAQQPHLENVYNSAGDAYGSAQAGINNLQPQVSSQMADALQSANGGYGNQMGGGFASGLQGQVGADNFNNASALQGQVGPNSYVNNLAGDMMSDAQKIKAQNLGGLDARAAASGMSGSSGYHNSANQMMNNVDEQTMQGMNQLRFNSYDRGVQNKMQLAGMMDQNAQRGVQNNMQLAGMMDQNQQGAMGQMLNMQQGSMNQFNPHMQGLNAAGAYGQIIGGPTVLGQSQSQNGSSASSQGTSSGFSNSVNYGLNQSGGYTGSNQYGASAGQGATNSSGWNAGASYV